MPRPVLAPARPLPTAATAAARIRRRAEVERLAADQGGVVHRRQLYAAGMTRWQVSAQVRADRWKRLGPETVLILPQGPSLETEWWRAVLEVGPGALLGGVSALESYGLRGIGSDRIQVAAPKSCRPRGARGVRVYETRRLRPEDIAVSTLPRLRPAPAALFAALWARSDREAALLIVAPVQQRITTAEAISTALDRVVRHPRRRLLRAVVADVREGAQSLGELDFARHVSPPRTPTPNPPARGSPPKWARLPRCLLGRLPPSCGDRRGSAPGCRCPPAGRLPPERGNPRWPYRAPGPCPCAAHRSGTLPRPGRTRLGHRWLARRLTSEEAWPIALTWSDAT